LRQRAAQHELTFGEGAMVWTVEATDDVEPLTAAVEVAAYRIVLEAVTNAVRHSGARACTVTLDREADELRVRVRDDGDGLAEDRRAGVGLESMRERAEELGGTCVVTSDGTGTLVDARLPVGTNGG
jgi:two-component system, NarL family, sensor kinase